MNKLEMMVKPYVEGTYIAHNLGNMYFEDLYLIKNVSVKSLLLVEGDPPIDELQAFQEVSFVPVCRFLEAPYGG